LGKTVRLRNKDHRKFMLRQPCLVCGRVPSDPHTSPLPNRARWAAKQATSSPSRSAEPTTGSSIARVMSWHGGAGSTLTRFQWRSSFGSRAGLMANSSRRPQELRRHGRQRQRLAQRRLDQARPLIQTPSRKARASRTADCLSGLFARNEQSQGVCVHLARNRIHSGRYRRRWR
jgi:hypothetical protein